MPFLGSQPADQYQSLAKQTITGDGSTAYTLNRSVTNAYDMEVFINNVRQEPDTSYSASGNTITFTAAVTASDSCYLIYQGQSVGSINPPANSVGGSQLANNTVTSAHLHTGFTLASSKLTGPLLTQADTWQNNANFTQSSGNNVDITTMARNTSVSFGGIGTGLSHSSGVFTFPETGIYFINAFMTAEGSGSGNLIIRETIDGGSNYSSLALTSMANMSTGHGYNWSCNGLMDVTDTSLVKFKIATYFSASGVVVMGNANYTITGVTVVRLGDT